MTLPELTGNGLGTDESLRWDRLAEAYDEGQLSQDEIRRTRARIVARTNARQRSKMRLVLVAGLQGFAIGLVTLGAGAWVTEKVLLSETQVTASGPRDEAKSVVAPASRPAIGTRPRAVAPPRTEPPTAAFDDAPEANATGTPPKGVPPTAPASIAASPLGLGQLPQLETPQDGPWKRVASALAANDLTRADWELSGLVASSDPATRDAAELTRAQLAISAGRGAATTGTLTRLAASGNTPLIRKRASELLTQVTGGQ